MADDDSQLTWSGRAILHVDMDAFFASVEQLDHPEWRGKPLVVGGSPEGRGVISAASYEARRYGVRSAMSAARAKALLPPGAVWVRGSHERYREMSRRIRKVFETFTPHVEQASIDEAYLDVSPSPGRPDDPALIAADIQAEVDALGLSCSVGVASTKTVAKIASDRDKPHGLTIVRPGEESAFLAPLPLRDMPGIGSVSAGRLAAHGIRTLGDVARLDQATATALLGSWGPGLVARARGEDASPVRAGAPAKSVSRETTFATDIRTDAEITRAVRELSASVAGRLARKGLSGRTVTVKLRYSDFTTRTVSRTVSRPVHREDELFGLAAEALRSAWTPGTGLRLLGVGVSNLERRAEQLDLFAEPGDGRDDRLAASIERIRERFGPHAVDMGLERDPDA